MTNRTENQKPTPHPEAGAMLVLQSGLLLAEVQHHAEWLMGQGFPAAVALNEAMTMWRTARAEQAFHAEV